MKIESPWTESELEDERVHDLVDQIMAKSPTPAPVDWRSVSEVDAPQKWRKLFGFVQWLVVRYQLPQNEIPQCWYRHGPLTEELSALHGAHVVCFDQTQIATAATDWHRVLFETRMRLREWAAATNCQANDHRSGQAQRWATSLTDEDRSAFAAHIEEFVSGLADESTAE